MIADPRILVMTAASADEAVFRELLAGSYPDVEITTEPARFGPSFARLRPHVLILAMRTVSESERVYRDVVRPAHGDLPAPHQTLLLCGKDDVRRAYELCRADYFDDYILFWPMVHDATRLSMSVHHALRFLEATRTAATVPAFTLQARRVATLEAGIEAERRTGNAHAQRAREAIEAVGSGLRTALDEFGRRIVDTGLDQAMVVGDPARVVAELERFDRQFVATPVAAALDATTPLDAWIDGLPNRLQGQIGAAGALERQAAAVPPLILVVDDDEFMCKLLLRLLQTGGYAAQSVDSAAKAIAYLRGRQPDLILMDVRLPDVDGIQLTRQLKAMEAYASIPIIMLTGQGQRHVLVDSRQAGATDFVVKPFDRETLLRKVATHLAQDVPD